MMDNIMKYKGYWAEIKYSDEDECFCGHIEGIKNSSISFEGETVWYSLPRKEKNS